MTAQISNLFGAIPSALQDELIQVLAESGNVRIERIVSDGHTTEPGEWYDQAWDEWVLLASGSAVVLFENNSVPAVLNPGDHLLIPAHCRHRVEQTDSGGKTVWVAVHFDGSSRQR